MQMVTAIVLCRQSARVTTVGHQLRKVDSRIEAAIAPSQNPLVHALPGRLPRRVAIALPVAAERRDGRHEDAEARLVGIGGDLLEGGDELVADALLGARVRRGAADVVDALEEQAVPDARGLEQVALVPLQQRGAETAGEDGVAAGCLVVDADVGQVGLLHLGEQQVRPPEQIYQHQPDLTFA